WKKLEDLRVDGRLVAAQRLPPRVVPIRILDILPDHWIVQPTREQKEELKAKLLERFPTLGAAYRAYGIAKDALSGRSAIRVDRFRALLRDLKLYQTWAMRPLAYGRKGATERLRVAVISPSLAYVLGFIHGDGHVVIDDRHSTLSIFQSRVHLKYISRILTASKKVSARRWGMHARETEATIRGGIATSSGYHMHRGSNLLAYLYDWLTANDLANLLRLDDEALRGFLAGLMDSDGCVSLKKSAKASHEYQSLDISLMFSSSRRANLRVMLALRRFDIFARLRQGNGVLYVQVTSRTDAARLVRCLSPYSAKTKDIPPALRSIPANHEEVPRSVVRSILQHVRPRPWSSLDKRYWSTLYDLAHGKRRSFKPSLRGLANAIRPWLGETGYAEIQRLLGSDYALERISEIRVEPHDGFVYDLRVPSVSNFVCDGVIVHNCIDEIEKMNPQDRSAIHEAMEQQRISVAKAGITAVLQSRCAILAAANPKFGRFDEHKYISEQIDLPPALLSRFDIIFSMIDRPQADRDRELAEHVLKGHRVGEIARRRETGAATEETQLLEEPYTPYFSPDFLRKYVAYAKRIYPVMTEEAMGIIEKKYLEIRKTGEGAGSSVPITPRQLEAIIRLAEAGARLRLSEAVTADDAERAVRIVEYWMGKVAGEEGRFDIDIIQTGISQSQREQIISIRDIINGLAGPEGVADYEDIVRLAQDRGIPPAKVDAWLKRWAQEGEIYSPAKNKYKLVERL
ncbi:MAG TPA: LAGLIDADG family homing endonuclease, partial [Thermoplasmata archaeon]